MKTKTSVIENSVNRSPLRHCLFLTALALACFALAPQAPAVCQEGCDRANKNTVLGWDALFIGGHIGGNTAIGYHALYSDNFGASNTAVGKDALYSTDGAYFNTGVGAGALSSDTNSGYNTAVGYSALNGITPGFAHSDNVAVGYLAMANADSFACVAIGSEALMVNTGQLNTAIGQRSMENNTSGAQNTAVGWASMLDNTTGLNNAAVGSAALASNTTGNSNSVLGVNGANYNTTGSNLVSVGYHALYNNTTGSNNTAVGSEAMAGPDLSGSWNVALGSNAGLNLSTGDYNIDIGNEGVAGESDTIRIGTAGTQTATYIAGIREAPLVHGTAVAVGITPDGQVGVRASSARYKQNIEPMDKASEAILALKPVTFRYKHELDPEGAPQFGLVAEDVEKVNPDLVACDAQGKPYTVRYEEVNAMLLNEFLKEHRKNEQQRKDFEAALAQQQKQIDALTASLQKVRAQLELSNSAPQTVLNNH